MFGMPNEEGEVGLCPRGGMQVWERTTARRGRRMNVSTRGAVTDCSDATLDSFGKGEFQLYLRYCFEVEANGKSQAPFYLSYQSVLKSCQTNSRHETLSIHSCILGDAISAHYAECCFHLVFTADQGFCLPPFVVESLDV